MAGGYAHNIDDIVDIHYTTVELAARLAGGPPPWYKRAPRP
jgi:hypothetical protein